MNIQNKIFGLYEEISSNKKMVKEVSDVYDNVDFKDNIVGKSKPSQDNINKALLADIETAAKNAGVQVDVTTAVSGHREKASSGNRSRHPSGNAVDIAIIDGKSVSPSIKSTVEKFVDELVKLGYTKNSESGNPKSVLTFGFPKHDNHIHISNTTSTPSTDTSDKEETEKDTEKGTDGILDLLGPLKGALGIFEQKQFGKNVTNRYGIIVIPGDVNNKIVTPISGIVNNTRYSSNCVNQITIENSDNKTLYLQFCGISSPKVRNGQKVSAGEVIGKTDDDVQVTLYDSSWNRKNIPDTGLKIVTTDKEAAEKAAKDGKERYYSPMTAELLGLPFSVFKDKFDSEGNKIEKRWGGVSDKQQVDPWILNALKNPFKSKKVNENVERIKKLL